MSPRRRSQFAWDDLTKQEWEAPIMKTSDVATSLGMSTRSVHRAVASGELGVDSKTFRGHNRWKPTTIWKLKQELEERGHQLGA